jgi:hypothetical protein
MAKTKVKTMLARLTYDGATFHFKSREMERTWKAHDFIEGLPERQQQTGGIEIKPEVVRDLQDRFAALQKPVWTEIYLSVVRV